MSRFRLLNNIIRGEYDMTYAEAAERMAMKYTTFCAKMSGQSPWTEPEMQRVVDTFGRPDEGLSDLFERRRT